MITVSSLFFSRGREERKENLRSCRWPLDFESRFSFLVTAAAIPRDKLEINMQPAVPPSSPPFPFSYRPSPPFSFSPRVASTFYRQLYRRKKGLTHIPLFPTLWGEGINSLLLSRARCSITFTIGLLRFAPPIFVTNLSARDEGNRERERESGKRALVASC